MRTWLHAREPAHERSPPLGQGKHKCRMCCKAKWSQEIHPFKQRGRTPPATSTRNSIQNMYTGGGRGHLASFSHQVNLNYPQPVVGCGREYCSLHRKSYDAMRPQIRPCAHRRGAYCNNISSHSVVCVVCEVDSSRRPSGPLAASPPSLHRDSCCFRRPGLFS